MAAFSFRSCALFAVVAYALAIFASQADAQPQFRLKRQRNTTIDAAHPTKGPRDFYVDGKHIPGVPFAVGDSYAGLLPISDSANDDRQLFFWWYPTETGVGDDSLVIWLNGGPGCSSLEGLLQENGPFLLPWNSNAPVRNDYSWTKLANVLWIEQPVGVGLGTGTPDISNEAQLAAEFYGFLVNFFKTFPNLRGKKLYLTGESYAGKYIPNIANHILRSVSPATNQRNGINFQGIQINDPSWTRDTLAEDLPAVEFAQEYQQELGLNDTTIGILRKMASNNGVLDYVQKNLQYPPRGPLSLPPQYSVKGYKAFDYMISAAQDANPCFNIYNIDSRCPSVYDPLGYPPDANDASPKNFINNVAGFKQYIHANPSKTWLECVNGVFRGRGASGDSSDFPLETGIMQYIVEHAPSGRTVIQHGLLDAILLASGSALGIQNMTFNGQRGFQSPPQQQLIVDGQEKGYLQIERGLAFLQASGSGHMIPQDQPATAYRMLQYLLGQVSANELTRRKKKHG